METDAPDTVAIRRLKPTSFLSFGPDFEGIELRPLNVLIGANGSGKSNFIEALRFLRASAGDWRRVIADGGGVEQWLWKGADPRSAEATVEAVFAGDTTAPPIRHAVKFGMRQDRFELRDESIEEMGSGEPHLVYRWDRGQPSIRRADGVRGVDRETIEPDRSIIGQRRDPESFPALAHLSSVYERIRIYGRLFEGAGAKLREPQSADLRTDRLEEDFSNLAGFLSHLKAHFPATKKALVAQLQDLADGMDDFDVEASRGFMNLVVTEGSRTIPAARLSDGTLRYLCLLAILCDPEPPPVVCIEEPELGLHPDALLGIADLLREAAGRTQLIVTTHSDVLVDRLGISPESLIVCEKRNGRTTMERPDPQELEDWLADSTLGNVWMQGKIGGTRW